VIIGVESAGAFTTIQDLGRPGWGSSGVPPSGAMDELALRAANLLAGNDEGAAALEITVSGPRLRFEEDAVCALAGATFDARINDQPIEPGRSVLVPVGTTLRIGSARAGLRGYLAIRGGIAVEPVLGSRSTLVSAGIGGLDGGALTDGATLPVGPSAPYDGRTRALKADALPGAAELRAIPGPQEDAFAPGTLDAFFSNSFTVSPRSDRAGVRLDGEALVLSGPADLDPEGVVTGAVQVPADGLPIVLGPDRPATGGYVKIATVIAADLPLLAQARPADTLRFAATTVEDARAAWRERLEALRNGVEER